MGITGLIPFLKNKVESTSAIKSGHLDQFRNKRVAIDGYSWLHKGTYCCVNELFYEKETTRHIDYCIKTLKMVLSYGIHVVLVFDGAKMPIKVVNVERQIRRHQAKQKALDLISMGKANEAFNSMLASIKVTHQMASDFIKAARALGVESIVAPLEADAQLAYLEREGLVDFIITEDSDLIVFGCNTIFFKMNVEGRGDIYKKSDLEMCLKHKSVRFRQFEFHKFRHAAILSGCDYLKSLTGIGITKAWKFMNLTANTDIKSFLKKVPSYLKLPIVVNEEYIQEFIFADLAFQHQTVFDPILKKERPLIEIVNINEDYKMFVNKFQKYSLDQFQLALGNIDHKGNKYDNYNPVDWVIFPKLKKIESSNNTCAFEIGGAYKRKRSADNQQDVIDDNKCDENIVESKENAVGGIFDLMQYYRTLDIAKTGNIEKEPEPELPKKRPCKFAKSRKTDDDDGCKSSFWNSNRDPSPTLPSTSTEISSPNLPSTSTEVSTPTLPSTSTEISNPTLPLTSTEVLSPTLLSTSKEVAIPTLPLTSTEVSSPTLPSSRTEVLSPISTPTRTEVSPPNEKVLISNSPVEIEVNFTNDSINYDIIQKKPVVDVKSDLKNTLKERNESTDKTDVIPKQSSVSEKVPLKENTSVQDKRTRIDVKKTEKPNQAKKSKPTKQTSLIGFITKTTVKKA